MSPIINYMCIQYLKFIQTSIFNRRYILSTFDIEILSFELFKSLKPKF